MEPCITMSINSRVNDMSTNLLLGVHLCKVTRMGKIKLIPINVLFDSKIINSCSFPFMQ